MRRRNRSDYLLIEILIAVFFLMITLTVLVQVFAQSSKMADRARIETMALSESQNILESITASEDPVEELTSLGFAEAHGYFTQAKDGYSVMVFGEYTEQETGKMWDGVLNAYVSQQDSGQGRQEAVELFSLPLTWYRGV